MTPVHVVSVMAGLVDFKNEEEVKEYLDNLGVEYHYACYKEKQPDGERGDHRHCMACAAGEACVMGSVFYFSCSEIMDHLRSGLDGC